MISFNVLKEPWIPVIRQDGSQDELGIVDCLTRAHKLREIRDPSPIIEFGLYRLLIAFILDALIFADRRPEHPLHLKNLLQASCFDIEMIDRYISHCGDVFELFHLERPFLQTKMADSKPKPIACLYPVIPSGTNAIHWHHESEHDVNMTAKVAARLLTTVSPFMTAGGAGLSPSINGAPGIYVLPLGSKFNLFETILLNIPLRVDQENGNGAIAWRNTSQPGRERTEATTVEALTWRPRRLQLVPNDPVKEVKFEKGDSTRFSWIDANLAYRYDKNGARPMRMQDKKPLWRDIGPLLLLNKGEYARGDNKISFKRPDAVEQALQLANKGSHLMIKAYAMRTDMKMKVFEWTKSYISIPPKLGLSSILGSHIQFELDMAEKAAWYLRKAIRSLSPHEVSTPLVALTDRCERTYWQRLEPHFYPLMEAFSLLDETNLTTEIVANTTQDWRNKICSLIREQFEVAAKDMDSDSSALKRQVEARGRLNYKLKEEILGK
ncbi:MAG: type I-E CRISPR-associated protein Cse1/CasA [Dehalococcoidales bacterium]|nr:type I-E CRISPR-associated protein Cse1/CasA [Dehalococcoidales bacterium]